MLRARTEDDARILHADLYEDVDTWVRSDTRPWVPIPFGSWSPYWPRGGRAVAPRTPPCSR